MPFKSKAQRRKFAQLLVEGKISNQTFEEWNREKGGKQLPERVVRKKPKRNAPDERHRHVGNDGVTSKRQTTMILMS